MAIKALAAVGLALAAATPVYLQADAPIAARVDDLIARMNVDEMIGQLVHWYTGTAAGIKSLFSTTGYGQSSMQSQFKGLSPSDTISARNSFQSYFMNNSRLGIPVSFAHEGLHSGGLFGTVFPEPCALGTTWNSTLMAAIGASLAVQSRSYGVDNVWSPVVNLWGSDGDARFGRYQEGFGPDPVLTSHLASSLVLGLQGGANDQEAYLPSFNTSVWSTAKHFAGYGAARGGLNGGEFVYNNRTLFEIYLKPWRALAALGLRGAMPSHNTVLDVPAHANRWLIDSVLRQEFGFGNGSTVSDCSDIYALFQGFGVANNQSVAAAFGSLAGVDVDLWCSHPTYYGGLNVTLSDGLVNIEDVKANVAHILTQKFAAGLFDQPLTPLDGVSRINTLADQQLALEAAQQSIVLLQNHNNVLPLKVPSGGQGFKVALVGPHLTCNEKNDSAIDWFATYGSSYGPLQPQTDGYATCYGRENLLGSYVLDQGYVSVPLLPDAWKATFPQSTINVSLGANIQDNTPRPDLVAQAVAAAQAADVAIVVAGDDLASCGEWIDRDDLDLSGSQLALLQALVNTTTPVVLVLVNGRAQSFGPGNALLQQLDAVIEAWRPGQAGSQAIVDMLTGRVNPSGKLANQWAQGVGETASGGSPFLSRVQGKWIANARSAPDATDGRMYDPYVLSQYGNQSGLPLFRFGHGLSYTSYSYKSLSVTVTAPDVTWAGEGGGLFSGRGKRGYQQALQTTVLTASVTLCNTGAMDGTETVQVYSQDPRGLAVSTLGIAPYWKRLVGFGRIQLAAGACGTLHVNVTADDLAMYDDAMQLRVLPGVYTISAGGRSDQDTLQQKVKIAGPPEGVTTPWNVGTEGLSPRDRLLKGMGVGQR